MSWKSMFFGLLNLPWKRDMTMAHYPLMGSPVPLLLITSCYLLFTLKIGPAFMRNRPAYKLQTTLLIYNLFQVLTNFCMLFSGLYKWIRKGPSDIGCLLYLTPEHPLYYDEIQFMYAFLMLKLVDLMDTIFFVLRKKQRQVTCLHVYHHVMMLLAPYTFSRYLYIGGHCVVMGVCNTFVHGFMYLYYLISARSPRTALLWKKYITILQLVQFLLVGMHNLWPLVMRPDCQYPRVILVFVLLQNVIMLVLFSKFFIKSYVRKETATNKGKVIDNEAKRK